MRDDSRQRKVILERHGRPLCHLFFLCRAQRLLLEQRRNTRRCSPSNLLSTSSSQPVTRFYQDHHSVERWPLSPPLSLTSSKATCPISKMCIYHYSDTRCHCTHLLWIDEAECCDKRYLPLLQDNEIADYSCPNSVVVWEGVSEYFCDNCTELTKMDWEYEDEELN